MDTLNAHVIPVQYREQTDSAGVMGGVTVGEHPVTGRVGWYVHPCRTEEVMRVVVGGEEKGKRLIGFEYLMVWIGAIGGCVGLDVPIELVKTEEGRV